MKKIKSVHVKPKFAAVLKVVGFLLLLFLGIFIYYRVQINDLKELGYSEKASNAILFSKNKRKVMDYGEKEINR